MYRTENTDFRSPLDLTKIHLSAELNTKKTFRNYNFISLVSPNILQTTPNIHMHIGKGRKLPALSEYSPKLINNNNNITSHRETAYVSKASSLRRM